MSERFIKFIPSDEAMYLVMNKGHAFRLLTIIAEAARRYSGSPDGLEIGEALIGDWKSYGMTERNYRTAKDVLVKRRHLKIVETCRNRKKSTTGTTTVGTKVKLISSNVYDINYKLDDDRTDDRATTERRPTDDELRKIRSISPNVDIQEIAQPAEQLRSKDPLSFDFEKWEFVGITETDVAEWRIAYPHIDLHGETIKAKNWIKSNPSKSKKTLWRKFLTGWYGRANDTIENKKAFRSASSSSSGDRRTKDIHGNPVESPYDGKF